MNLKTKGIAFLSALLFFASTLYFTHAEVGTTKDSIILDEKKLGEMCLGQVMPITENYEREIDLNEIVEKNNENVTESNDNTINENNVNVNNNNKPLVIIYHTHSSESYMPYKESNYHRTEEVGTVRDVGNVIEKELEQQGIGVIHDKTIHDRPSYNESYTRSLETIKALVKKYPTASYIIDLHRDAAPSSVPEGKYIEINSTRVATFSMVVGKLNENYVELYDHAKDISKAAEEMYPGFGGKIIEKDYNYNEFVSNKALLLEVGNNKNTIEEARKCGEYFAKVLASVIKENQ